MTYTAPATVIDKPSALNMQGFVGNDLIVRLNVLGDAAMPDTVNCIAYYSSGGRPLPEAQQPAVGVDNRAIVIHFAGSDRYPYTAWHKILWNGRAVLSGDLTFSREASRTGPTTNSLNITVADGQVVNVSVLVGASAGGGSQSASYALSSVTTARYRHNFGRVPSATVLNSLGVEVVAAVRHIYETGSTITNEIEIATNQPITGRLILHA